MSPSRLPLIITVLLASAAYPMSLMAAETITIDSLLREMVDRDRLARLPEPAYRCGQFSSYERASVAPGKPGWFANHDEGNYLRTETTAGRTEYVMMDADGPGAIVTFFKASCADNTAVLRIYLDGSATPAIAENFRYLLGGGQETAHERQVGNRVPPFPADEGHFLGGFGTIKAPFAGVQSLGSDLYLPIPYSRHCKVTYDKPGKCYYRVNYRSYARGTVVETFTTDRLKAAAPVMAMVGKTLQEDEATGEAGEPVLPDRVQTLAPGASLAVALAGPAAIRGLLVKVESAKAQAQALRSTVLVITCDGAPTVWCPVSDFFCSGSGLHTQRNWDTAVGADGALRCRWVMPFQKYCQVELLNLGRRPVTATLGGIRSGPWSWDRRSMHFHAGWRQQYPITTKGADGTMDWNYLEASGQGVYVGDTLIIHNGSSRWWGEGDEKISIDGESFPSHFGTGTEDYYGYSLGGRDSQAFAVPFGAHVQVEGDKTPGYSAMTRLRGLDAIPFNRGLKFDMEIWHWETTTVAYAATTYWYGAPGATSNRGPEREEAARALLAEGGP